MRNLNTSELTTLLKEFVIGGRHLKKTPFFSREAMKAWQFERIQKLVTHAWTHIPFYKKHYSAVDFHPNDLRSWDAFHQLPIVSKDDVIDHYPEQMLKADYDLDNLIVSRSSGSSGKVLDICYNSEAMTIYSLAGLRLYNMGFNYRPWHHQLYVYTSTYPMSSVFGLYPMHHVSTLETIEAIAATIERIRPQLLVCYPSHLKQIEPALSQRAKSRLKSVSVNSEMSTQAERDYLSSKLGCPVLDEYSSEELTRIAAQCKCGNYHIFEDINYMETLPTGNGSNDSPGVIIGTNLHNYAMPMIRYEQNDLGSIIEQPCGCGWNYRQLVNLQGRKNDSFLMPSGKEISSGFLLDATYEILLTWRDAVVDFCLIQESKRHIVLQVIPDRGWNEAIEAQIRQQFQNYFEPEVSFQVMQVSTCEKTKTGKRNPIIRRFK